MPLPLLSPPDTLITGDTEYVLSSTPPDGRYPTRSGRNRWTMNNARNIVPVPSFENNSISGWGWSNTGVTGTQSLATSTVWAQEGTYSLLASQQNTNPAGTAMLTITSATPTLRPIIFDEDPDNGKIAPYYTFAGTINVTVAPPNGIVPGALLHDNGEVDDQVLFTGPLISGTGIKRFAVLIDGTAIPYPYEIIPRFTINLASATATFHIDALSITPTDSVPDFYDGTKGASWRRYNQALTDVSDAPFNEGQAVADWVINFDALGELTSNSGVSIAQEHARF